MTSRSRTLLRQESFDDGTIYTALEDKARVHDVVLGLENGVPEDDVDAVRAYWNQALDRLVTEHVPFDDVVEAIDASLRSLAERTS